MGFTLLRLGAIYYALFVFFDQAGQQWKQFYSPLLLTKKVINGAEKVNKHSTHTLPNVNAKVSMDAYISPNIAFLFSGLTSLQSTAVKQR